MSKSDFKNFQDKFNLSDNFISIVDSLFEKLVYFGYIGIFKKKKLIEKLYENVSEIYIGTKNEFDYKSGFYDANKKVLYIKDEKNIPTIYLRLLYAITTNQISNNATSSGYMITQLRTDSYKLEHINFAINRAIMSNLVCKLCDLVPLDISILSGYKTFTHNFLGYNIETGNNLYGLEGKVFSELCYCLNIDEQLFYTGIFSKEPVKYIEALFAKKNLKLDNEFFKIFDETSRKYNWYNKLSFLSRKLNNNYLEFKKHALEDDVEKLITEKDAILNQIKNVLLSTKVSDRFNMDDADNEEFTDASLNEAISNLETTLKQNIIAMQNILCEKIISSDAYLTDYQYASRLKQFSSMLIMPNEELEEAITHSILYKLLPKDEITSVNLTVKIKYMLIQNILSENKYTAISKAFSFNIIPDLIDETHGVALALLNINSRFARLVQISDLNLPLEQMNTSPSFIPLDNFAYLMNSDYSNMYVGFLEKIYTALRFKFNEFKNLKLNELYMFEYNQKKYLIVTMPTKVYVLTVDVFQSNYDFKILNISEQYSLFEKSNIKFNSSGSNLPTIYNNYPPA